MPTAMKKKNPKGRRGWIFALTFILSSLVFYLSGSATAEMYRWVDENGETQITDSPPPDIKAKQGVKIYRDIPQERQPSEPTSEVKEVNKDAAKPSLAPKKKHEVVLYSTSWCPYCRKARDFFRTRGIDFIEYDIEQDKEAALRKKQMDPKGGVPFAIINGRSVRGFSASAYERALNE